jgi:hypothetical protein
VEANSLGDVVLLGQQQHVHNQLMKKSSSNLGNSRKYASAEQEALREELMQLILESEVFELIKNEDVSINDGIEHENMPARIDPI